MSEQSTSSATPRVAVVTGGSRGIGRETAERLAADGFAVVVNYAGNEAEADKAVAAITEKGGQAVAVRADVADENEVAALFDAAENTYGGVDVVVHAAGVMALAPLVDLDLDALDRMHRTNIRGTFVVDQQAARRLRAGGAIINFSSSVLALAIPGYTAYAATKGAVEAVTLILAREMRGRDITVNAVAPGPTATALFLDGKDEETIARMAAQPPLERLGTPRTSPGSSPSSPVLPAAGSTARSSGPTAASLKPLKPLKSLRSSVMSKVIVITGAGSGFGALSARALARAGHTVYAAMRDISGRNADRVKEAEAYAAEHRVDLRTVELDVLSQESADAAVATILAEAGRLDVLVHNAGHMVTGPTEAFTPEELAAVYDTNVLGTQRVNRAALPHLRAQGHGLVLWVGSTSTRGGTPPYLAPYFAAKAAMDSLAVSYAAELARFDIETTIVVPGSFTSGTNHFATGGHPAEQTVIPAYEERYAGLMDQVSQRLAALAPADADVSQVADAIVGIVDTPHGERPFRVHIDPANDGSEEVSRVADRIRAEFLKRIGLEDLLAPHQGV